MLVVELLGELESILGYIPGDREIKKLSSANGKVGRLCKRLVVKLGLDVPTYTHRDWV